MGNDPDTSVINGWCESHDVKGLFVIDGAFVTAAAVNPTNTIQAISLRTVIYPEAKVDKIVSGFKKFRTIEIF